ncbi:hypothetical protein KOR42_50580 [Thalassoglobus neptunius]|uniref:tRNA3(Ser)-specific nuclease WapA n=1 Tax=Thalassoglobus neptunius TaxID=1938619 RepID=A0A5C5VQP8_9PLAN|nr:RHS repeat-associated core domain-containing protein [Thalassoglobus neptunius]TWT39912.1 hypothetical protein KOR42_50580 [Thalassoglobus neptunius]
MKLQDGATTVQENEYDGLNRRTIRKTYTSGTLSEKRFYFYTEDWQCIEERVADGSTTPGLLPAKEQHVWGNRYIDECVLRDRDYNNNGTTLEERLYATQDANWNTTMLYKQSSGYKERYTYNPYGEITFLNSSFNPVGGSVHNWQHLFGSYKRDTTTELYLVRNRLYHTDLGTWLSRDPIGYEGGTSLYEYVNSKPNVRFDPYGLEDWAGRIGDVFGKQEFPATEVQGLYGDSLHLNDRWFKDSQLGAPCVVCHGMSGQGRVGPVNSFRFPAGPAQLHKYQSIRDVTALGADTLLPGLPNLPQSAKTLTQSAKRGLSRLRNGITLHPPANPNSLRLPASHAINMRGRGQIEYYATLCRSSASSKKAIPGAVAQLTSKRTGKSYFAASRPREPLTPSVQKAYDLVNPADRAGFHSKCAEGQAASACEACGDTLEGATMRTANVRSYANLEHGTPKKPCKSCDPVLEFLKINYE